MAISASDLISKFQQALDERWGYIWGTRGDLWTQDRQNRTTRAMTVRHGSKWIGRRVADCSGLFYWAFKQLGGHIFHGSNTIWNQYCSAQGKLHSGILLKPGTAVFHVSSNGIRGHIGLYIGGGKVIEAKGTRYGVVTSSLSGWHEWGELKGVLYDNGENNMGEHQTEISTIKLKRNDRGAEVISLQKLLNKKINAGLTEDGIFGSKTEAAVKTFQRENALSVDGIAGRKTFAALNAAPDAAKPEVEETPPALNPLSEKQKLDILWNDFVKRTEARQ